ncbi:MAG TPA: alpha/beta hydrolase [Chloroflexia bacterium]|nr:alpha/beta hydrolase [Chloroflexia bacterium]
MPLARVNGAEIYYDEFGSGEPLVMIHGMLATGRTHAVLALQFSNRYRVIVPDLRGYGRSGPKPRVFPLDFYQQDADDVAALLQHLGVRDVRVFGVGDGAEAALLMAVRHPALVRAVVAVDATGSFGPELLNVLPQLGTWADEASTDNLSRRNEVFREYGEAATLAMWQGWKAAIRGIVAAGGNISLKQAGSIRCPVLVINGADDAVNTPAMSQALVSRIPRAELRLVPDHNQLVTNRQIRPFSDPILAWLAAH